MTKQPSLFLSYCWLDKELADTIQRNLGNVGVSLMRDISDLQYTDNLKQFMLNVRKTDFTIILLTDNYLKSVNCMYEAIELMKEINFSSKLLPVMMDNLKIFKPADQIPYITYWKDEKEQLEKLTSSLNTSVGLSQFEQLKFVNQIYHSIDDFIKNITCLKIMTLLDLQKEYYKPMLLRMGFLETTIFQEVIRIDNITEIEQQEIFIDEYILKYPKSTYGYELKARIAKKQKLYEKAKVNYIKAIELDDKNWQAHYNLGNLIDENFGDHKGSIQYYEAAIKSNPLLSIARLNLGYVYSYNLGDQKKAQEQFSEALKINPNDGDAHKKMANSLRIRKPYNVDLILYHFKKALEYSPNDYSVYFNYGDFLRLIGEKEEGEKYFQIAIDKMPKNEGHLHIIFENDDIAHKSL